MKYAIISDIHANLEALQAVIEDAAPYADVFICLGDIVGYNASPIECLQIIQSLCQVTVIGNHDLAAVGLRPYDDFNPYAQEAIDWTREQLSSSDMAYLAGLPMCAPFGRNQTYLAAHGSPRHTDEYLFQPQRIQANFMYMRQFEPNIHCCFVGHTHVPMVWECTADGILLMVETISTDAVHLDSTSTYIVNPGSVGQPRNGDPTSSYILLDDVDQTITYRGVPYDILAAQDKIYDAMLPMPLAERLEIGR